MPQRQPQRQPLPRQGASLRCDRRLCPLTLAGLFSPSRPRIMAVSPPVPPHTPSSPVLSNPASADFKDAVFMQYAYCMHDEMIWHDACNDPTEPKVMGYALRTRR